MIDFKEELKKYKPALEADDLERELGSADTQDVMKLLQYLIKRTNDGVNRDYTQTRGETTTDKE